MLTIKDSFATPKIKTETNSKKARLEAKALFMKGVQRGAQQIESYIPALLEKSLDSTVWSWPRPTIRANGAVVGDPRSITDTGRLKRSGKVTTKFLQTKTVFNVRYSAPYASLVHNGGYIFPYGDSTRNPTFLPARPWISAVLDGGVGGVESIDITSYMQEAIGGEWT